MNKITKSIHSIAEYKHTYILVNDVIIKVIFITNILLNFFP